MSRVGNAHHHSAISVGGAHPTATHCSLLSTHCFLMTHCYILYPSILRIMSSQRQPDLTLTHNSRKTFIPMIASSSSLASCPTFFNIIPPFPITIPFCESLST